MTTLRVIVDQMVAAAPGGISRYTEELTRELIHTSPPGCSVEAIVPASPEAQYALIDERLPGLTAVYKTVLDRRQLAAAWQHGFTRLPGSGILHSPSLLAPLAKHDRLQNSDEQIAVTIHDSIAWTAPHALRPRAVAWHRAMARRAERYADAVVVPTHAVASELGDFLDLGDRVRVIAGAPSSSLVPPVDSEERATRLALPEQYVLAMGPIDERRGIPALMRAMAMAPLADIPLLIVGDVADADARNRAKVNGMRPEMIRALGQVEDPDLAVAYTRASVFAFPSVAEGFGLPLVEAFSLETPVVHSDAPALIEVAADAGLAVARDDPQGYPQRLADAISSVLFDHNLAERLRTTGLDRARAFSWRDSAEKIWQLHADL